MWQTLWPALRISVLSFLGIIASMLCGIGALTLFGLSNAGVHTSLIYAYMPGIIGSAMLVLLGGGLLFAAALSLVFGVGIWTRRPHMWTLGVLSQGFIMFVALVELLSGSLASVQLLSLFVASMILAILYTSSFQASLVVQR